MKEHALLDWDSEFFGFGVAKIIPSTLDADRLSEILEDLRRQNVSLVYWASDSDSRESQIAGNSAGGLLVDRKITYVLDLETLDKHSFGQAGIVEAYAAPTASEKLEDLAIQSGAYSRFRADPRIPSEQFEELYRIWIRRSVTGEIANAVLVINGESDTVCGMITLGERRGRGDIGLVAVETSSRGRGYGRLLVEAALHFFSSQGYRHSQVVTQADNEPACRLYEAVGYRVETRENLFHFWLT